MLSSGSVSRRRPIICHAVWEGRGSKINSSLLCFQWTYTCTYTCTCTWTCTWRLLCHDQHVPTVSPSTRMAPQTGDISSFLTYMSWSILSVRLASCWLTCAALTLQFIPVVTVSCWTCFLFCDLPISSGRCEVQPVQSSACWCGPPPSTSPPVIEVTQLNHQKLQQ